MIRLMKTRNRIFLERDGNRLSLPDRFSHLAVKILEHRVTRCLAGDVQSLEDRNTTGDKCPQGTGRPGQAVLFNQRSKHRDLEQEQVPAHPTVTELSQELDKDPESYRDGRDQEPEPDRVFRDGNQQLGCCR